MAAGKPHRREVAAALLKDATDDLLVVAGLGGSAGDVTAVEDRALNLPLLGGMGGAVMTGLGLALAQPRKRVLVVTGDGDLLMGLGSLATVAAQRPANLAIVVMDNEKFAETGNQATHTAPPHLGPTERGAGADLTAIALGAGIADSATIDDPGQIAQLVRDALAKAGPVFRNVKVLAEPLPLVLPPMEGSVLKDRFRRALLGRP
ncbi:MAG: aldehyde dehydrogenase [Rhodospirillales bacterium]|nr:MAG: aldehyde dehydrogenase [Rhodospirillales bacterium]